MAESKTDASTRRDEDCNTSLLSDKPEPAASEHCTDEATCGMNWLVFN